MQTALPNLLEIFLQIKQHATRSDYAYMANNQPEIYRRAKLNEEIFDGIICDLLFIGLFRR